MNILNLDITGKVSVYDNSLYQSILDKDEGRNNIICLTPFKSYYSDSLCKEKLYCFVPEKKSYSKGVKKRFLKVGEALANYIRTESLINKYNIEVLHLQWLPFLEICSIEYYILRLLKSRHANLKIILTVHNIFPHNFSQRKKESYKHRFIRTSHYIDHFIVHTNQSKEDLKTIFGIDEDSISVIKHGAFVPKTLPHCAREMDYKVRLLIFGLQSSYKGTDLLVDAVNRLPEKQKVNVELRIVGKTSEDIISFIQTHKNERITLRNEFVSDGDLYQEIADADVLVYPYRNISQSGALLLGLSFGKPIIASDLPAFVETLHNYPNEMFFQTGSVDSLARTILYYLSTDSEYKSNLSLILKKLLQENSWKKSSEDTLTLYNQLVKCH